MIRWGEVVAVSPTVDVRFAGDTVDVTVSLQNDDITLAVGDVVAVFKVGSQWVIGFVIGAAP